MGKCSVYFDEMRFDVRDEQITHAYCLVRTQGDCPIQLPGWYHKAFPSTMSSLDILQAIKDGKEQILMWDQGAPKN